MQPKSQMIINAQKIYNERLFSNSRLELIDRCLLAFFFRYIWQVIETESSYLHLGKAVHKAIECYIKGDEKKASLMAGMTEINYYPINFNEYVDLFKRSLPYAKRIVDGHNIEQELHFKIELENGIFLQGYIDYLEQYGNSKVYLIRDWKTNRIMYEALDTYQLALYSYAMSILKNTDAIVGEYVFLRYFKNNRKTHSFTQLEIERAIQWAVQNAKKALDAVEQFLGGVPVDEAFPRCLNDKCSHCPFATLCLVSEEDGMESIL